MQMTPHSSNKLMSQRTSAALTSKWRVIWKEQAQPDVGASCTTAQMSVCRPHSISRHAPIQTGFHKYQDSPLSAKLGARSGSFRKSQTVVKQRDIITQPLGSISLSGKLLHSTAYISPPSIWKWSVPTCASFLTSYLTTVKSQNLRHLSQRV